MKIAIRYCGGCNPEIDREGLVRDLEAALGRDLPSWQTDHEPPDLLIEVCGCARSCPSSNDSDEGQCRKVVVAGPAIDGWPVEAGSLSAELERIVLEIMDRRD
ncbi:MAG: hypothetical protein KKB20_09610 [Proteobacteria bacterium]|nr:hypothetical protein [Pseudomonadota bacterium]